MKQHQHRPATRAPHGAPEFIERIALYCTKRHKRAFRARGGSEWVRRLIDADLAANPVDPKPVRGPRRPAR